eukprot:scaffold31459_cov15-Tisochrysis_lutea.AAC.1
MSLTHGHGITSEPVELTQGHQASSFVETFKFASRIRKLVLHTELGARLEQRQGFKRAMCGARDRSWQASIMSVVMLRKPPAFALAMSSNCQE